MGKLNDALSPGENAANLLQNMLDDTDDHAAQDSVFWEPLNPMQRATLMYAARVPLSDLPPSVLRASMSTMLCNAGDRGPRRRLFRRVTHMCEVVNPRQVLKSDVQLSVIPQGLQPNTIKRRSATGGQLMLMTGAGRRRMSTVDNAFAQCTGFSRCPPCLRLSHARAACGLWRQVSEQALHRMSEATTQRHTAAERYAAACLLESDH